MTGYIIRRLLVIPCLLLLLALTTFLAFRLAPGSPLQDPGALSGDIALQFTQQMPANSSWFDQFQAYVMGLLDGSLPSMKRPGLTVGELVGASLPVSLLLGLAALTLALVVGVPLGVLAAVRQGSIWDRAVTILAATGISVPNFVLGPLLVLCFALVLSWFPPARFDGPSSLVLPALTLGVAHAASFARLTRAGMLDVLRMDFVRTARAKGLSERRTVLRHVLPGALVPLLTYLGPTVASIVTGTAIVEKIFQIPGLGYYFVQSAIDQDYSMVLGVVTFFGGLLMVLNLLVDIAYGLLDPRVRIP